ncbi:hypothetical protein [Bradyrhizobium cenepequi]
MPNWQPRAAHAKSALRATGASHLAAGESLIDLQNYAALRQRSPGALSLRGGGVGSLRSLDLTSATRWQTGQLNTCSIIVGWSATSADRYHFISMWQLGHIGTSTCSRDRLSRSIVCYFTLLA